MRGQDGRNPISKDLDRQLTPCAARDAPYLENTMHWRYERERGHTEDPTATTAARVAGSNRSSTPSRETYDDTCGAKLNHAPPATRMVRHRTLLPGLPGPNMRHEKNGRIDESTVGREPAPRMVRHRTLLPG